MKRQPAGRGTPKAIRVDNGLVESISSPVDFFDMTEADVIEALGGISTAAPTTVLPKKGLRNTWLLSVFEPRDHVVRRAGEAGPPHRAAAIGSPRGFQETMGRDP